MNNKQGILFGTAATAAIIGISLWGGFHAILPREDFIGLVLVVLLVLAVLGLFLNLASRAIFRFFGAEPTEAPVVLVWVFAVLLAAVGVRTLVPLFDFGEASDLQRLFFRFSDTLLTAAVLSGSARLWDRLLGLRWDGWPFRR